MNLYVDPSAVIGLLLADKGSERVSTLFAREDDTVPINLLQEFELKNALRQKVFRAEITEGECVAAFRRFDDMFVRGAFAHVPVNYAAIFHEAERLSKRFCLRQNGRAFDVLHVAAALVGKARRFVTFDADQAALAKASGLRLVDL